MTQKDWALLVQYARHILRVRNDPFMSQVNAIEKYCTEIYDQMIGDKREATRIHRKAWIKAHRKEYRRRYRETKRKDRAAARDREKLAGGTETVQDDLARKAARGSKHNARRKRAVRQDGDKLDELRQRDRGPLYDD